MSAPRDYQPGRTHHHRPPEVWALIREGWEAGETSAAVARRHDVAASTVLRRRKLEGWIRKLPVRPAEPAQFRPLSDPADIAEAALAQATQLLQSGRPAEAVALLKAADAVGGYAEYVAHLREELAAERAEAAALRAKPPAAAVDAAFTPPVDLRKS